MTSCRIGVYGKTLAAALSLLGSAASASQGPGGGPGTASSMTQLAMAVIVYGTCAILVLVGLIGASRPSR